MVGAGWGDWWQGGSFRATKPRGLSARPPAETGGGWELRLGLQRSDSRERTGVGCVNTACRGLVCHS